LAPAQPRRAAHRLADPVRIEQVRLLYADGLGGYLPPVGCAVILAGVLVWQHTLDPRIGAVWVTAVILQISARTWLRRAYVRSPRQQDWRVWGRRFVLGSVASGLIWGGGLPFLMAPGRLDLQAVVIGVMIAGTYGIVGSAGSYLPAFYTFFLPFPPLLTWCVWQGDILHGACAAMIGLWLPGVATMGRRYNQTLTEALQLRFENAALVEGLRAQKRAAEQSSLAKSRFLASASHDLRQPVHALGMFMGALRGHRLPRRSRALIDHIDASIAALDGLFTSLLDISRLDAGVTETHPCAMPLQPLLHRICRDLEPEARARGLRLRAVATTAVVRSDPVLLERILRNLAANAVRHTHRGRVLIGCRRRGGRISLEVWDTGPGIPPDQRAAIFEEFYQVANPDRDRAKGLGLGLAIVQRLAAMLGHPVTLDSWPGRGSVFRVSAPTAPAAEVVATSGETLLAGLRTGFIIAIDDEAAVRVAMSQLLRGWGHRVLVAAGEAEALEALADIPTRPDLIICDYRLRDGENGIEVIRRLQSEYNEEIPALLLTGDTALERLREAEASGYPMLHKPLAHARLRAAVHNLLSGAAAPDRVAAVG